MVEITCRTLQGRRLLRPSALLNRLILGVPARAVGLFGVEIHGHAFPSNHDHLIVTLLDGLHWPSS